MEYAIDRLEDLGLRKLAIMNIEKDEEIERLNNIIKEVREYVTDIVLDETYTKCILEILNKGEKQ